MQLGEMFPNRFLRGQDMTTPLLIVIRSVTTEKVRAGQGKPEEVKYILRFELAKVERQITSLPTTSRPPEGYGLVLRKTLAAEIFAATRTTDTNDWTACKVVIEPHTERAAGRDVIAIHARAPKTAPQPVQQPAPAATTPA
jgi:hypothetical protein